MPNNSYSPDIPVRSDSWGAAKGHIKLCDIAAFWFVRPATEKLKPQLKLTSYDGSQYTALKINRDAFQSQVRQAKLSFIFCVRAGAHSQEEKFININAMKVLYSGAMSDLAKIAFNGSKNHLYTPLDRENKRAMINSEFFDYLQRLVRQKMKTALKLKNSSVNLQGLAKADCQWGTVSLNEIARISLPQDKDARSLSAEFETYKGEIYFASANQDIFETLREAANHRFLQAKPYGVHDENIHFLNSRYVEIIGGDHEYDDAELSYKGQSSKISYYAPDKAGRALTVQNVIDFMP